MQIISELEGHRRGPYAGAVGYALPDGTLDTCIAIRTVVLQDGVALVGSSPERLVACENGHASLCPIAGTTEPTEGDVERLLSSEKDRAGPRTPESRSR